MVRSSASSIALGVVLKGINLAQQWGIRNLAVVTDSSTVCSWLNLVINDDKRIDVHGISETLVMCRLSIVKELVAEGGIKIHPQLVKLAENKADILTRVCVEWLKHPKVCSALSTSEVLDRHTKHHFGFKKTKYFIQAEK